jgi:hypothetical protein
MLRERLFIMLHSKVQVFSTYSLYDLTNMVVTFEGQQGNVEDNTIMSDDIVSNHDGMEMDEIGEGSESDLELPMEKPVVKKIGKTPEAKKPAQVTPSGQKGSKMDKVDHAAFIGAIVSSAESNASLKRKAQEEPESPTPAAKSVRKRGKGAATPKFRG